MYNLVKLCHKLFYYDYAHKHHEVQDVQVVDLVGGGVVRVLWQLVNLVKSAERRVCLSMNRNVVIFSSGIDCEIVCRVV